jgi:hypothetical protein
MEDISTILAARQTGLAAGRDGSIELARTASETRSSSTRSPRVRDLSRSGAAAGDVMDRGHGRCAAHEACAGFVRLVDAARARIRHARSPT